MAGLRSRHSQEKTMILKGINDSIGIALVNNFRLNAANIKTLNRESGSQKA